MIKPTRELVLRKVEQIFSGESFAREALSALDRYGVEPRELERERVQLAILKLSEGILDQLKKDVEAAKVDYRDLLAWAEFPEQSRAGAPGPNDTPESLIARRKRDRQQYEQWLKQ